VLQPLKSRNHFAVAASISLQREQCGDCLLHNTGATGTVVATLPPGTDRLKVRALRTAAQTFTLDPYGTEIIKGRDGVSLGAGVAKSLTDLGAYCELEYTNGAWNVLVDLPQGAAALADDSVTAAKIADGAIDDAAKIGGGVVTPPKLVGTGMKWGHFVARNGAGAITLTGAAVGDRVLGGWKSGDASDHNTAGEGSVATTAAFVALFEAAITVVNQIQQASATDLSDNKYTVILLPAAA
jgi:hypothetical protein